MSKKRKKKKRDLHPMPKLGFVDQCIYWAAMLLTGGGSFAVMLLHYSLRDKIAFADDRVVASSAGRGELNWFWLCFWLLIVFIIILAGPYQSRLPIFGRKGVKYGPPAYPRTYPLLMKDKPKHWVSPKVQANLRTARRVGLAAAALTLAFSLAMFPRSLYGRNNLLHDGTVTVYSPGNRETEHYKFSDIAAVELDIHKYKHHKSYRYFWYINMVVRFSDGSDFSFRSGDFAGTWEQTLQAMLALKERYGSLITIAEDADLNALIHDRELTPTEQALLRELFS